MTPYDSPALRYQSWMYPVEWLGRIPKRVQLLRTVRSDMHWIGPIKQPVAMCGAQYDAWVNINGAVTALFETGEQLGLRPDEFRIIEWHDQEKEVV